MEVSGDDDIDLGLHADNLFLLHWTIMSFFKSFEFAGQLCAWIINPLSAKTHYITF